jgi:hypothetical protein
MTIELKHSFDTPRGRYFVSPEGRVFK